MYISINTEQIKDEKILYSKINSAIAIVDDLGVNTMGESSYCIFIDDDLFLVGRTENTAETVLNMCKLHKGDERIKMYFWGISSQFIVEIIEKFGSEIVIRSVNKGDIDERNISRAREIIRRMKVNDEVLVF